MKNINVYLVNYFQLLHCSNLFYVLQGVYLSGLNILIHIK